MHKCNALPWCVAWWWFSPLTHQQTASTLTTRRHFPHTTLAYTQHRRVAAQGHAASPPRTHQSFGLGVYLRPLSPHHLLSHVQNKFVHRNRYQEMPLRTHSSLLKCPQLPLQPRPLTALPHYILTCLNSCHALPPPPSPPARRGLSLGGVEGVPGSL